MLKTIAITAVLIASTAPATAQSRAGRQVGRRSGVFRAWPDVDVSATELAQRTKSWPRPIRCRCSKAAARTTARQAKVEFVPKGQKFDELAETALPPRSSCRRRRTLANVREDLILELSQTCKPDLTGFFQLDTG